MIQSDMLVQPGCRLDRCNSRFPLLLCPPLQHIPGVLGNGAALPKQPANRKQLLRQLLTGLRQPVRQPPGYDTLMNSQLPSYDDSIVQKTNLPAQVLRNKIDEYLFLKMLPSSLLSFFIPKSPIACVSRWGWFRWSRKRRP